jgi:hypothetical protein
MKNYGMAMVFVASFTVLGASTGCAVSSPAPDTDSASGTSDETIVVNNESQAALPDAGIRIERRAGDPAFSLVGGHDWRVVAPGVWELPSVDGAGAERIVAGEEGHRWLLEQADAELDALYERLDREDETPELAGKIAAAEEKRETAQRAMMAVTGGPSSLTVSCNIARYTGASSYVTSPPVFGAAALAQIVCSGGCQTFTVTSQACCSTGCSSAPAATRTVCSTPWTAGTIRLGSGFGSASVTVSPPYITQSNPGFVCN